jgi:hypothetical protein
LITLEDFLKLPKVFSHPYQWRLVPVVKVVPDYSQRSAALVPDDHLKQHFHIRWFPSDTIDWEPFETRELADERGRQLVGAGEEFIVQRFTENCESCRSLKSQRYGGHA